MTPKRTRRVIICKRAHAKVRISLQVLCHDSINLLSSTAVEQRPWVFTRRVIDALFKCIYESPDCASAYHLTERTPRDASGSCVEMVLPPARLL
tara:strand:+ start:257 stop:538 length:282 start_codon:yes stop_codon:yes gene_type:complete